MVVLVIRWLRDSYFEIFWSIDNRKPFPVDDLHTLLYPVADVNIFFVKVYFLATQIAVATPFARFTVSSSAVLEQMIVLGESVYQVVGGKRVPGLSQLIVALVDLVVELVGVEAPSPIGSAI